MGTDDIVNLSKVLIRELDFSSPEVLQDTGWLSEILIQVRIST